MLTSRITLEIGGEGGQLAGNGNYSENTADVNRGWWSRYGTAEQADAGHPLMGPIEECNSSIVLCPLICGRVVGGDGGLRPRQLKPFLFFFTRTLNLLRTGRTTRKSLPK